MDETSVTWLVLIFTLLLRITQAHNESFQNCIHKYGSLVALSVQWYSVLGVLLFWLLIRTVWDIVIYDYVKYHFLDESIVGEHLNRTIWAQQTCDPDNFPDSGTVHKEIAMLRLTGPVKALSLATPIFALLTAALVFMSIARLVKETRSMWLEMVGQPAFHWGTNMRLNMILNVLFTPLVFVVMAQRATLRQWAIMTTSAYKTGYLTACESGGDTLTWQEVKLLEHATYEADLELANFFQFCTIFAFGYLCGIFMSRTPVLQLDELPDPNTQDENEMHKNAYRRTLQWLSIQGLLAYVLVGMVRTLVSMFCTVAAETKALQEKALQLEDTVLQATSNIFTFVTIFCVINMMFIGKLKDVRDHLGSNVNQKFLGTRILLLIAQMQLKVLAAFTVGSEIYLKVQLALSKHSFIRKYFDIDDWAFGGVKARLLHSSLLVIECFLVAVANFIVWKFDDKNVSNLLQDTTFLSKGLARPLKA